jgi:hypothetical protein
MSVGDWRIPQGYPSSGIGTNKKQHFGLGTWEKVRLSAQPDFKSRPANLNYEN